MKRSPLRPVSPRRRALNAERRRLLEARYGKRNSWRCFVKDRPQMLALMGPCFGPVDGHETLKRSRGGSIVDLDIIVMLCAHHNGWVEDNPQTAHALGLADHGWEKR